MRIGIIQFPGSNCERETILSVQRAGMEAVPFLWNEPIGKLCELDGYVIVGGFSYEDRSRAGIIAALDPVMQAIKNESESGKPVLGICNGAQILVETGLVPGLENNKIGLALTENKRLGYGKILGTGFYNAWVDMRLTDEYQRNAFTHHLTPHEILHVPVAHAQGRFVMTSALLEEIKLQGLNVFQYCDRVGNVNEHFPVNPNGSINNIAAIANKAGNILAMMPHPERTPNGDPIFKSMRDYIANKRFLRTQPLSYYPRLAVPRPFTPAGGAVAVTVKLIITDNEALTVENTLQQLGFPVRVSRYIYWQITTHDLEEMKRIKASGVLFNPRKETEVVYKPNPHSVTYLVQSKEDLFGQEKLQLLKNHFSIQGVTNISHSILWQFDFESANIAELKTELIKTHIIHNPYAHNIYEFC